MKFLSPATNFQDKGSQLFNVLAYGAKGDGSTDDATAIQSAITAAQSAGGIVYLPPATYLIGTTLTISGDNVCIQGAGWASVLKVKNSTNIYAITVDNASIRKYLKFVDFKIDGNRLNNTSSGGGITGALGESELSHVWITACRDKSLNLTGTALSVFGFNNWVHHCLFDNATPNGIYMTNNDENIITANVFSDFTTYAIYDNAGYQMIANNTFVGGGSASTGVMVYSFNTAGTIVTNNVFDGPHEEAIKTNSDKTTITYNQVSKVGGVNTTTVPGINVSGGTGSKVVGNNVSGGTYYTYAISDAGTNTTVMDNTCAAGLTGTYNLSTTTQGLFFSGQNVGLNTVSPTEKLDVKGNLKLKDADTATKAYRFRTSGASLDWDFAGSDIYFSAYPNADFSGTQRFYMHFNSSSTAADAYGTWRLYDVPFGTLRVTFDATSSTPLAVVGDMTVSAAGTTSTSVVTTAATQTLTNKRLTSRINTTTSSATPAINVDTTDQFNITALAANITSMTSGLTGTPTDGQKLLIRIKGTASRTITWGTSFASSGTATLLATTSGTNTHLIGFIYDSVSAKWICTAVDATGY